MSARQLKKMVSKMVQHYYPGIRLDELGQESQIEVPFKLLPFSSDAKRKTAAYDRIGVTCSSDFLRDGEVAIRAGDYLLVNNSPEGLIDRVLVSKLISNTAVLNNTSALTQFSAELLLCNLLCNVKSVEIVTDEETGQNTSESVLKYSNIFCSISTAEIYATDPSGETKDEFYLVYPQTLEIPVGADIEILNFMGTEFKLQHSVYTVMYHEPNPIGVTLARIKESFNDG